MATNTEGSSVNAGKKPLDNSLGQYWENLIPAWARDNDRSASSDNLVVTGTPGAIVNDIFCAQFHTGG